MLSPRRTFLKALLALPVAAKEAAGKMGLEGVLGGSIYAHNTMIHAEAPAPPAAGYESWAQRMVRNFSRKTVVRERRQTVEWQARRLDTDLASMRSLSPAAAFAIQRERTAARVDREHWDTLQERITEEAMDNVRNGLMS